MREGQGGGAREDFAELLEDLEDRRTGKARRHSPPEIVVIALCAVLSGGETCAARSHWGIENSLHWVRAVTFDGDRARNRTDHGTETLAHFASPQMR